jgi:hypothetical protein
MGVSMRRTRTQRRAIIDLRRIQIGDYIILFAAALATVSLFLTWFSSSAVATRSEWAFTYSEWASIIVIVFFLATLFLVIYPALSPDLRLPVLPVSTPLIFLAMGAALLLIAVYQLGRYDCISCQGLGVGRGFGLWVFLISAIIFIVGSVIKWGSRPHARAR